MLTENLQELKQSAKQLGVSWQDVCQLKDELVEQERQRRWTTDGVRSEAWSLFLLYSGRSVGCQPFWRVGWRKVRERFDKKGWDFVRIPRYDQIATAIASEYPEWSNREPSDLFEFLFSDYQQWPSRLDFYEHAIGQIESQCQAVPF